MMTHRSVLVSRAWSFSRGRFVWTLVLGGLLTGAQGACAQEKYLEWSDNTGRFKVDAQYLRVEGEQLVLKRVDGREIKIPFERLSPESLELARTKSGISIPKGASPGAPSKATPSKAVPEKTSPESSTPVTKFQDNMDPKEFIDLVFKETSQDNYVVMWDAMPASKQKQLEELMVEFARKVDPRSFDMIRKTRNSLVEILRKQQKFILNSSVLAMPADVRQEFEPVYPAMVDVADHLVAKELLDGKRMQQGNMRGLLDTYLTRLLKSVEKAIVTLPTDNPIRSQYEDAKILNKPNWTVEKTSSTSATLSIPQPIALVLSEGRWLPEDLVKNWDMGISQAKGFIATMNPEQIQQGITTVSFVVNAPLNSLKNAKSQEEFDKVLGELSALVPPGIGPASLFGTPELGMPGGGLGMPGGGLGMPGGGLGMPGGGLGMPGGGLGTTGSGGPSGGPQPGKPASPSGKMQKVVFEDYSFELPDRFVEGPKAPPPPPGMNIKAAVWQSRNQQGELNELWVVTRIEDPKLAGAPNFDSMKALQAFTRGFVSKQQGWKVQEYGDLKTRGTPSQPIHVTRTLVQMPLGEIIGYSAVLKSQDHLVYVISFQYNGDVLNQIIELEKCLDTMKRN